MKNLTVYSKALLLFVFIIAGSVFAAEVPAPASTTYRLSTCVVSGNKLGVMGPPTIIQEKGTEVRFCCKDCVKDFNKDPKKYLKKLHDPAQQAKSSVSTTSLL